MRSPSSDRLARPIRILIADDHTLFRRGLTEVLSAEEDFAVTAEAGDAPSLLARVRECRHDLVLLDIHLAGRDGLDLIPEILEAAPTARILVLTVSDSPEDLFRAFRAGASGYLLKTVDPEDLVQAIRDLRGGESAVSPSLLGAFLRFQREAGDGDGVTARRPSLSSRELEVLNRMAEGRLNKEIARLLKISEFTVKNHVKRILMKLSAANRTHAVTQALHLGLLRRTGPLP